MTHTVPDIFKDTALQRQFNEDGFVKLTLFGEDDIKQLHRIYTDYSPNPSTDFFSSSHENDYALKTEVSNALGKIIIPKLETILTNFTCFGCAFLTKGNGPNSELYMHQDWSIVDETKFVALNVWTPLQETNEENGTLELIKGSHHWNNALRAPTLPFYYEEYQDQLKEKLTVVPVLPTEVIILNQATIHYSKPNKTNKVRVAITSGVKTKDAPMQFHYWNKEKPGEIEEFKMADDFLLSFQDFHNSIFKRPVMGESLGTKQFILPMATANEIENLIGPVIVKNPAPVKGQGFAQKLLAWMKA